MRSHQRHRFDLGLFSFFYSDTRSVKSPSPYTSIDQMRLPCECINRSEVVAATRKPFVMRQKHKQVTGTAKRKYMLKYLNGNVLLSLLHASHAVVVSVVFLAVVASHLLEIILTVLWGKKSFSIILSNEKHPFILIW